MGERKSRNGEKKEEVVPEAIILLPRRLEIGGGGEKGRVLRRWVRGKGNMIRHSFVPGECDGEKERG